MKFILLIIIVWNIENCFAQTDIETFYNENAIEELRLKFNSGQNFLVNLGFKKFTDKMNSSLNDSRTNDVSKKVLNYGLKRYATIDLSRDLASHLSTTSFYDLNSHPEKIRKIESLIEYLLLPRRNVESILTKKGTGENLLNSFDEFEKSNQKQLLKEKNEILQAFLEISNSNATQLNKNEFNLILEKSIKDYLSSLNADIDFEQSHFLGRAILASYIHAIRVQNLEKLEFELKNKLNAHNIYIQNYISSKVIYKSLDNKEVQIQLHRGDFANEYSKGAEAYYISIGTYPAGLKNEIKAIKDNLLGNVFLAAIYPTPTQEEKLQKRVDDNKKLTMLEKLQWHLLKGKKNISGYSHVGMVDIYKESETGIEMPWIWDSYPNDELGGIRFIGVEGFAFAGDYAKVGFTHYSPQKFLNFAQKQIVKNGYQENVWKSSEVSLDENENIIPDKTKVYWWRANISKRDVFSILNVKSVDAENWFQSFVAPKLVAQFEDYMTGIEATAFSNGFLNVRGALYCSLAIEMAFLQGINVEPQVTQDSVSPIVRIGKKLNLPDLVDIDLNQRIISPSGFAWQKALIDTNQSVMLPKDVSLEDTSLNLKILSNVLDPEFSKSINQNFVLNFETVNN